MSNYNEMIGESIGTDAGDHTIIAHIIDDGNTDKSLNLYVGRDAKGYCNLIARDNASWWVVGDEDDALRNWQTIDTALNYNGFFNRYADPSQNAINRIRAIDSDLAEWLEDRIVEALGLVRVGNCDEYDRDGDEALIRIFHSQPGKDNAEIIAELWDEINMDDVVAIGFGGPGKLYYVTDDTRTIDGLTDLKADIYWAGYPDEGDCADWTFFDRHGNILDCDED